MAQDPMPANQMNAVRRAAYEALSRDAAPWCTPLFREVVQLVLTYADLRSYESETGTSWQWEINIGPTEVANLLGRARSNGIRADVRKVFEALSDIGLLRLTFRARGPLAATYEVRPSTDIEWAHAAEILKGARRKKNPVPTAGAVGIETAGATETAGAVTSDSAITEETAPAVTERPLERSVLTAGAVSSLPYREQGEEMADVVPQPLDARATLPGVDSYVDELSAAQLRAWMRSHVTAEECWSCYTDDHCDVGRAAYERLRQCGLPFTPHRPPVQREPAR